MSFYLYVPDCYSNFITLQEAIYFQISDVFTTFYHMDKSRFWPLMYIEGSSNCSVLAANYRLMRGCDDLCSPMCMQLFIFPVWVRMEFLNTVKQNETVNFWSLNGCDACGRTYWPPRDISGPSSYSAQDPLQAVASPGWCGSPFLVVPRSLVSTVTDWAKHWKFQVQRNKMQIFLLL